MSNFDLPGEGFLQELAEQRRTLLNGALESVTALSEEQKAWARQEGFVAFDHYHYIAAPLLGADGLRIEHALPTIPSRPDIDATSVNVRLSREGEAYTHPGDRSTPLHDSGSYCVIAMPDAPIVAINANHLETSSHGTGHINDLREMFAKKRERIHVLTGDECQVVLGGLKQSVAHVDHEFLIEYIREGHAG
jgi:hypothetical protein